jgi:two-component system chemotaxis response regulator CheB
VSRIRVLVVDDSLTVRMRLAAALGADPGCEVVGQAADGEGAIELCARLKPDVMTLDMVLPNRSGLEVTEHVMAFCPTPILIVSSSFERGELFQMFDALTAGAVDTLEKPRADHDQDGWDLRFVSAVKLVARIKVITHLRGRLRTPAAPLAARAEPAACLPEGPANADSRPTSTENPANAEPRQGGYRLVAIGASTGGPAAVVAALRPLPPTFPLPILLVLHIGAPFGQAFAEWLGREIALPVSMAADGEPLPPPGAPGVKMAPAGRHLVVRAGRLRLTSDPERHGCRPSVDTLFESVAAHVGGGAIGCLLTGMGRDGAAGLLEMRRAGAVTFAQDQASSIVFGMPRAAIALGAVSRVLPAGGMGPALMQLAMSAKERT